MPARASFIALAVLDCGLAVAACSRSEAGPAAQGPPPMPVQVEAVKSVPLLDANEYVSVLRSRQAVQIQPQVQGHVTRILVTSGDEVRPRTPLIEIDPSQQQAAVNSQRANLDLARKQTERVRRLFAGGAATRQDLDQAEAALASAQAQTEAQSVELHYFRVVAPTAGTIGDIPVRVGDFVTTQTLLTTIDDNRTLEAYVNIPLERTAGARLGTPVEIIDAAGKVLAPSEVTFVSPRADPATQMVLLKTSVDNQGGRLRSGQFARARVIWSRREGPVVPMLSVWSRAGQSFVWVASPGPGGQLSAEPRAVQVGPIQDQSYPILKGVKAGDKVVVSGVQKLRPGAPLAPLPNPGQGQTQGKGG